VDLLPTVLDLLRIPAPSDQLYEGRSLYALRNGESRLIYLNSYQQYGVIAGDRLVMGDREAEAGGAGGARRTVYAISNQGTRTAFTEDRGGAARAVSIRQFDEFQESLLRNYGFYRGCFRRGRGEETSNSELQAPSFVKSTSEGGPEKHQAPSSKGRL